MRLNAISWDMGLAQGRTRGRDVSWSKSFPFLRSLFQYPKIVPRRKKGSSGLELCVYILDRVSVGLLVPGQPVGSFSWKECHDVADNGSTSDTDIEQKRWRKRLLSVRQTSSLIVESGAV